MKTTFHVFLISMILVLGCTSIHHVKQDESSYTNITNEIKGKHALLTLTNGQTVKADNVSVKLDSTSWVDAEQNKQVVPTSEVKEITIKDRGKGAVQGCLSGGVIGAGVGFPVGFFIGASKDESGLGKFWGVISGIPAGMLVGLIIGSERGVIENYVLEASIEALDQSSLKTMEGNEIILSDRVGEVIDLAERNKYKLFPTINGFQSAVLMKSFDGNYTFKITYLDEMTGEEKIQWIARTELQIRAIRKHVDQFE